MSPPGLWWPVSSMSQPDVCPNWVTSGHNDDIRFRQKWFAASHNMSQVSAAPNFFFFWFHIGSMLRPTGWGGGGAPVETHDIPLQAPPPHHPASSQPAPPSLGCMNSTRVPLCTLLKLLLQTCPQLQICELNIRWVWGEESANTRQTR